MPDDGQFACVAQVACHRLGVHGVGAACTYASEAQEVKDERVDDLEGQGVLLLEKCLDEDVAGASGIRVRRHLLGSDLAETVEGGGRV